MTANLVVQGEVKGVLYEVEHSVLSGIEEVFYSERGQRFTACGEEGSGQWLKNTDETSLDEAGTRGAAQAEAISGNQADAVGIHVL